MTDDTLVPDDEGYVTEDELELSHDEWMRVEFERLFVSSFEALICEPISDPRGEFTACDPSEESLKWLVGLRADPIKRVESADQAVALDKWFESPSYEGKQQALVNGWAV